MLFSNRCISNDNFGFIIALTLDNNLTIQQFPNLFEFAKPITSIKSAIYKYLDIT